MSEVTAPARVLQQLSPIARWGATVMEADEERLEALAREYEHRVGFFARKIAREYLIGTRWNDELMSAGYWGLAMALQRRRPDASERELSAYVSMRIAGAVIDAARSCINRSRRYQLLTASLGEAGSAGSGNSPGDWFARLPSDGSDSPEARVISSQIRREIDQALARLDPRQQSLVRSYMAGASLREIADRDGVPLSTLRLHFDKATRLLRTMLPGVRRVMASS